MLVKSTAVSWPETCDQSWLFLLPVKAIYNIPAHIPLSAVSNLHLQEPFGGGGGGGWAGLLKRQCRHADMQTHDLVPHSQ